VKTSDFSQVSICRSPIFVIGSPRSGTTILALSLAQHSHLWYSSESHLFPLLFGGKEFQEVYTSELARRRWVWQEDVSKEEFLESMGLGLNALFTSRSHGKRWVEKTPQNTPMVSLLAEMFPQAYFLHILRDGRAVVNSMIHMNAPPLWARHFKIACWAWRDYVKSALEFEAAYPKRCRTVRLEALMADPGATFAEMFQFIQVPDESGPADFFRSHRLNSSFAGGSDTVPEPWGQWTGEQKATYLREVGDILSHFHLVGDDEMRQMEMEAYPARDQPEGITTLKPAPRADATSSASKARVIRSAKSC
jgi:hypothetical protein